MKEYYEIAENVFRRRDEYETQKAARRQRYKKIATTLTIFVICFVILFSVGGGYVYAVSQGIIEDHLGICEKFFRVPVSLKQELVVEKSAVLIGDVVACNGFAVTAQSAFTDGSTAFILLQITGPELMDLNLNAIHFNIDMRGIIRGDNPSKSLGSGDTGISQALLDDGDGAENTQEILIEISTTSLPEYGFSFADGYDRYLFLEGIYAYKEEYPYNKYKITDGEWSFKIHFDDTFNNIEKEFLDAPFRINIRRALYDVQQTAIVHSIVIRGLSMTLRYTYEKDAVPEPGDFGDVKIVLTDGTIIKLSPKMGGSSGVADEFITTYQATSPILINEIDYIQIGESTVITNKLHQGNPMIPLYEE